MLLAHNNLSDSDNASSITAGSEKSSLPVSNLQENPVAKVWQTADSTSSTHITVDMGSSMTIRVVALIGTNLDNCDIRIRGDDSDNTAVEGDEFDSGTVDSQIHKDYKDIYFVLGSDTAARYWRIDISNVDRTSTGDSFIEAGRLFMGPAFIPNKAAQFNWRNTFRDKSRHVRSIGQQIYVDPLNQTRELQFTMDFQSESQSYDSIFEFDRAAGRQKGFLVMMDENESDDLRRSQWSMYGIITRSTPVVHRTIGVFRKRYTIEERL